MRATKAHCFAFQVSLSRVITAADRPAERSGGRLGLADLVLERLRQDLATTAKRGAPPPVAWMV